MNAIQMAVTAALKNMMGNLPPEINDMIGQIGKSVASFGAQLDRIEQQNRDILNALERTRNVEESGRHVGDEGNGRTAAL